MNTHFCHRKELLNISEPTRKTPCSLLNQHSAKSLMHRVGRMQPLKSARTFSKVTAHHNTFWCVVENGETVSGPMLHEKRKWSEDLFKLPDDERLCADEWLPSFCKTYKIKEHKQHREAESVDLKAVEHERKHMYKLTKTGLFF